MANILSPLPNINELNEHTSFRTTSSIADLGKRFQVMVYKPRDLKPSPEVRHLHSPKSRRVWTAAPSRFRVISACRRSLANQNRSLNRECVVYNSYSLRAGPNECKAVLHLLQLFFVLPRSSENLWCDIDSKINALFQHRSTPPSQAMLHEGLGSLGPTGYGIHGWIPQQHGFLL